LFRIFLPTCFGIPTVLDYYNSQIISLETGPAAKQGGTFKIFHLINLHSYEETPAKLDESFHSLSSSHLGARLVLGGRCTPMKQTWVAQNAQESACGTPTF